MSDMPKKLGATTSLVPIKDMISEDYAGQGALIVSPSGNFRMVLKAGSVNFEMKDDMVQLGMLQGFGSLLTNLDEKFPIEIIVHSKQLDTDAYRDQFENRLKNIHTPDAIKGLIREHLEHFETVVKHDSLLQKERYIVIPWNGIPGWQRRKSADDFPLTGLVKQVMNKAEGRMTNISVSDEDITVARQQLEVRSDQIISRLYAIGVSAHRMDKAELESLLYEYYHPERARIHSVPGVKGFSMIPGFNPDSVTAAPTLPSDRQISEFSFGDDAA